MARRTSPQEAYPVFAIMITAKTYLFRQLRRSEYKEIMGRGVDKYRVEELIASTCLVKPRILPSRWDSMPAGVPTALSDEILFRSGFSPDLPTESSRRVL